MIKILDVKKGGEYFNISFKDEGNTLYGLILVLVEKRPIVAEFVRFDTEDPDRLIYINKDSAPDEYAEMEADFLQPILDHIKTL